MVKRGIIPGADTSVNAEKTPNITAWRAYKRKERIMKRVRILADRIKKVLFTAVLFMVVLAGCGQQMAEPKSVEETDSFEFEVEDVFALSDGSGVVVVGYVQSGIMKTGAAAVLVKEDGTTIETVIGTLETYSAQTESYIHPSEVDTGVPVGVLLEGLEKEQVDIGDLLTNKEY